MSFLTSMKCTLTCCPNPKGNLLCLVHRVTLMSFFTFMITIDALYQEVWSGTTWRIDNWRCPLDWEALLRKSCRLSKVTWIHEPVGSSQICCSCNIQPWLIWNSILSSRYTSGEVWAYVLLQGWTGDPDMASLTAEATSGLRKWSNWDQWSSNPRFLTIPLIRELLFLMDLEQLERLWFKVKLVWWKAEWWEVA